MMTRIAQILSTGSYVPERVVTNAEIDEILGEQTSDWLVENVGILQRHWMTPDQTTSDLVVGLA
jgi:3-oxoacyl-[acyl-carrier-protein] synthase-3